MLPTLFMMRVTVKKRRGGARKNAHRFPSGELLSATLETNCAETALSLWFWRDFCKAKIPPK
jgi:hypothetical protein